MIPVDYLVIAGLKAARHAKGWTQEDAAREFRHLGLRAWRGSTVGQMECGLRRPLFGELILMCAALGIAVRDLIPDSDETADVNDGVTMPCRALRDLISGNAMSVVVSVSQPGKDLVPEAERLAARRLDIPEMQVRDIAQALWGRDLVSEREARVGNGDGMSHRSRQARRGIVTRALTAEMNQWMRAGS